jgi:hypothetical protein
MCYDGANNNLSIDEKTCCDSKYSIPLDIPTYGRDTRLKALPVSTPSLASTCILLNTEKMVDFIIVVVFYYTCK